MRVLGLAVDQGGSPVVLLTPLLGDRPARIVVPIWIGDQEAASISIALQGQSPPRPLAHDLMRSLLLVAGATVDRVAVVRLDDGVFFAELTVATVGGPAVLDCRPSDAIALALRLSAPVFMAEAVLAEAGVREDAAEASDQEVEAFRRFLDSVAPEDFQG